MMLLQPLPCPAKGDQTAAGKRGTMRRRAVPRTTGGALHRAGFDRAVRRRAGQDCRDLTGLRVAVVGSRGYPSTYGGFETLVRRLAPYLRDGGCDVTVYCREERLRWRSSMVDGIRCLTTPSLDRKSLSTLTSGFTAALDSLGRQFDAVLVLNVANGFYIPLLKAKGCPVAVNVDGLEWERKKWGSVGRSTFKAGSAATARFADRIIVDSLALGQAWSELFGRSGTFIPYGADVVEDRPTHRLETVRLRPQEYMLVVARLVPENNVDLILHAIEQLDSNMPLVVVGSANYDNDTVASLQRFMRSRPHSQWLGHVSDQELLTDLWAHCALYLHGHSVGGTNPALLQALGAGSPTLALDTVYNREVVGSEEQLFEADSFGLARRIGEVLDDPHLRDRWSATGREIIRTRYVWNDVCAAYADLLQDMAGMNRQGHSSTDDDSATIS